MKTALALDSDNCLAQVLHSTESDQLKISSLATADQFYASFTDGNPDLVILHLDLSGKSASGFEFVSKLRQSHPNLPTILLSSKPSEQAWQEVMKRPGVELVQIPFTPSELRFRIMNLFQRHWIRPKPADLLVATVDKLHNKESGRLDAALISDVFGISVADVARCVNRDDRTVRRTTDAPAIQKGLHHFERIASGLVKLTGSLDTLKIWLNVPNPRFENNPPVIFLQKGDVEFLANIVDDALMGHPA